MFKKIIKEPLLHFALLGVLLFWVFAYLNPVVENTVDKVLVTEHKIQQLNTIYQKKWRRSPTAAELKKLIDDYVIEEIYYREALAMQMDKNDTVIRRRLRQKMEFLLADASAATEPTEAQLQAYLDENAAEFEIPAQYSLQQIYLNTTRPGSAQRVAEVQQALEEGLYVTGDTTMLPKRVKDTPADRIDHLFGHGFTKSFAEMPLQTWQGPVKSGFGLHWVYLEQREQSRKAKLDEVRAEVLREFEYDLRLDLQRRVTDKLLEKYTIEVEWPKPDTAEPIKVN
jgi:hypothetical protein